MIERIKKLVKEPIEKAGYELYDVEYVKEGNDMILRIIIDNKEDNISLDDCVIVTDIINPIIDKDDPIPNEYMLEVCSAGAERRLRNKDDERKYLGSYVHVETSEETHEGYLEEVNDTSIVIKINLKGRMKNILINDEDISFIRLAIKF